MKSCIKSFVALLLGENDGDGEEDLIVQLKPDYINQKLLYYGEYGGTIWHIVQNVELKMRMKQNFV